MKIIKVMEGHGHYAVFEAQYYMSGDFSSWQQISKWYFYKKCANNNLDKILKERRKI